VHRHASDHLAHARGRSARAYARYHCFPRSRRDPAPPDRRKRSRTFRALLYDQFPGITPRNNELAREARKQRQRHAIPSRRRDCGCTLCDTRATPVSDYYAVTNAPRPSNYHAPQTLPRQFTGCLTRLKKERELLPLRANLSYPSYAIDLTRRTRAGMMIARITVTRCDRFRVKSAPPPSPLTVSPSLFLAYERYLISN